MSELLRVLPDTSTLVAAVQINHPKHEPALNWLRKIQRGEVIGYLSTHSLAEFYTVATKLANKPIITPQEALDLLKREVIPYFQIVPLEQDDYLAMIQDLVNKGLFGPVTYDALIIHAARKINVDLIVTLNLDDFHRVAPEFASQIIEP